MWRHGCTSGLPWAWRCRFWRDRQSQARPPQDIAKSLDGGGRDAQIKPRRWRSLAIAMLLSVLWPAVAMRDTRRRYRRFDASLCPCGVARPPPVRPWWKRRWARISWLLGKAATGSCRDLRGHTWLRLAAFVATDPDDPPILRCWESRLPARRLPLQYRRWIPAGQRNYRHA